MSRSKRSFTRRHFLKAAGIAAAAAACTPAPTAAPTTAPGEEGGPATITGGPLEVGVLYEEGDWYDLSVEVGDSLEADYPGTEVTYTFANTASDAARALRWESGDPLDVDASRYNNESRPTWSAIDNKQLLDLTPYMEQPLANGEAWGDSFLPVIKSFAVDQRPDSPTNGHWFAAPSELTIMLVHYNRRAFEEMGVEPAKTWPEFLELCAAIDEKGAATGMKPVCVSGPTDVYCGHWWDRMVQRTVGRPGVDAVAFGDAHLRDDPGFMQAAVEIEKLPANNWFMEGYEGADFTGAQALFFQGKAAMIHMGSWLLAEMADVVPADFEIGVFDFPTVPDGKGNQAGMFGTANQWSIPNPEISQSHEVNVELAVEYLRRYTSREAATKRAEVLNIISPVKDVPAPAKLPGVDALLEQAASGEFINFYYGIHLDQALWAAWYPPVQALFLKQMDAATMIEQMDENLDRYRAQKAAGATATP